MESQNKNLKSIFFNFLLLLAFIFSIMALYISLSFSEKITSKPHTIEDELSSEIEKLNQTITDLEKTFLDQSNDLKIVEERLLQLEKKVAYAPLNSAKKEPPKAQKNSQSLTRFHVIQPGETFSKVSKIYGVSLNALMKANKDLNPKALRVGQKIVIP